MTAKSYRIVRRFVLIAAIILVIFATYRTARIIRISVPQKIVEIPQQATSSETASVIRVIDGDTIEVTGGRHVRYIGINTPELTACFGGIAKDENSVLVNGKTIRMVRDISDTDTYGRLLRYVYVGNEVVNDTFVRQGFAVAEPVKPDTLFASQFLTAQNEAKREQRGLWKECKSI